MLAVGDGELVVVDERDEKRTAAHVARTDAGAGVDACGGTLKSQVGDASHVTPKFIRRPRRARPRHGLQSSGSLAGACCEQETSW